MSVAQSATAEPGADVDKITMDQQTQYRSPSSSSTPDSKTANVIERDNPRPPDIHTDSGKYTTTRQEIWAYYAYYIGNNGLPLFNFAPTQSQNLIAQAADPDTGTLPFLGANRTSNSIVLLANGISFAIQVLVFLIVGSYADFGTWRPTILLVSSCVAYGVGFGWLGVKQASKWREGVGLYMIGLIAYQTSLTFWTAAFPGLARNTPFMREQAEELSKGQLDREEYDRQDSLMRSKLSNMAFYIQSVGELFVLAIIVGVMFGVRVNDSEANNTFGLSVLIAFASGVWLLLSIPWFVLEKRRPGITPNRNIVVAGLLQLWSALTKAWKLKQSLYYLIGYFLLGDSLNTTVTVVATLQNSVVEYSTLDLTYLLLVGIATQAIGIYSFWFVQRRYGFTSKTMFNVIAFNIVVLDGWGLVGIFQQNFGFHNKWEFWLYQGFYGLCVCPWYSYSQIMISEVTPRGHEFLFFSLFSIMGKTSSFIGPIVSSAIIDASANNNESSPFYFLFGLSLVSFLFLLFFIDLKKSRREQDAFLEEEAEKRYKKDVVIS